MEGGQVSNNLTRSLFLTMLSPADGDSILVIIYLPLFTFIVAGDYSSIDFLATSMNHNIHS
jgi:hypothetical protein